MRKFIKTLVVAAFVFSSCAIAFAIHEIIPSETQIVEPGPDAEDLNEYIVKYNPYRAWNLWPGKGRLYKANEPLGLVTTFVNNAAYHSIKNKKPMADRSMIVTENYSADKEFLGLFVMYKVKGFNPEAGDWFWVLYAPDGTVETSGKAEECIDCHTKKKGNDYIFTGSDKKK